MKYAFLLALCLSSVAALADSERLANGKLISTGMSQAEVMSIAGSPSQAKTVKMPFTSQDCYQLGLTDLQCSQRYSTHEEWLYRENERVITVKLRDGKVFALQSTLAR